VRITVKNLACRRSGRLVFADLSFTLTAGEALVVTGRNGAGKSSLLALLAGRLRPDAGSIAADGLGEDSLAEHLHAVGHRDALKPALTAAENLGFVRDLFGKPGLSPREALDVVGLAHAASLPVAYLSAGQRRRVALARLLVAHRSLWLLDEPIAALDGAAQDTLLHFMTAHLSDGGLIVAATHAPLGIGGAKELKLDQPTSLQAGEVERTEGAPGEGGNTAFPERPALPDPPNAGVPEFGTQTRKSETSDLRARGDSTSPVKGEGF
jgi:heme exporter protein A